MSLVARIRRTQDRLVTTGTAGYESSSTQAVMAIERSSAAVDWLRTTSAEAFAAFGISRSSSQRTSNGVFRSFQPISSRITEVPLVVVTTLSLHLAVKPAVLF